MPLSMEGKGVGAEGQGDMGLTQLLLLWCGLPNLAEGKLGARGTAIPAAPVIAPVPPFTKSWIFLWEDPLYQAKVRGKVLQLGHQAKGLGAGD